MGFPPRIAGGVESAAGLFGLFELSMRVVDLRDRILVKHPRVSDHTKNFALHFQPVHKHQKVGAIQ
jgi:hypothetical protein